MYRAAPVRRIFHVISRVANRPTIPVCQSETCVTPAPLIPDWDELAPSISIDA
jgi:hypothetical protein